MAYTFPEQKTLFSGKPFSSENLVRIFEEIFRLPRPFTGFLRFEVENGPLYFLFFLQSNPYAAGKFDGKKPFSLTVGGLFAEIFALAPERLRLSLCETDPVLLKCMLVLLQEEPTIKAPATMIDLEQIVEQVVAEKGDALVVLEKEGLFNFFFIKQGMAAKPHLADKGWTAPDDLSALETLLVYAFEPHATPVVAHVYRDVTTQPCDDLAELERERLLQLARQGAVSPPAAVSATTTITLEILSGLDRGKRYTRDLPCSVGRKGCDLIFDDGMMSRRHALFTRVGEQVAVADQGSTNGTLVNGAVIAQATPLGAADIVTIGETTIKILL